MECWKGEDNALLALLIFLENVCIYIYIFVIVVLLFLFFS